MEITTFFAGKILLFFLSVLFILPIMMKKIPDFGNKMEIISQPFLEKETSVLHSLKNKKFPTIHVEHQKIKLNEHYNPLDWVQVVDSQDGNITKKVEFVHNINIHEKGVYEVKYFVRNSLGLKSTKTIRVIVD